MNKKGDRVPRCETPQKCSSSMKVFVRLRSDSMSLLYVLSLATCEDLHLKEDHNVGQLTFHKTARP